MSHMLHYHKFKVCNNGDRSRKETLVDHGFRLPSALDNRPLKIDEFHESQNQVIFTSATPSKRVGILRRGSS